MYRLLAIVLVVAFEAACGGGDPSGSGTELRAQAQVSINGMQTKLDGQFRIEAEGRRLQAKLDNTGLPTGTAISFCLVTPSGSVALAAPQTVAAGGQDMASFQFDSQASQSVPNVVAGNTLEARQGAMSSGAADCAAPLIVSASFVPDIDEEGGM